MKIDEIKKPVLDVVSNKKYQWIATIIALIIVLMMSSSIRLSNWDLLTDSTTGEKIPLALDPYYFLRVAETIVETGGDMPEFDEMRYNPAIETPWHPEIMPEIVVGMWKVANYFGDYTLRAVNIFSPVFFYGIGLILFFILTYILTRSKFAALLASTFLAFTPAYLYRTMAGFSDHEAIGMIGFFGVIIGFSLTLKYLDKMRRREFFRSSIFGLVIGLLTALTIAFWGGIAIFVFMIIPIAFLIFWITKMRDSENCLKDNGIFYYVSWIVFTVLFGTLLGNSAMSIVNRFLTSNGIVGAFVLGLIILDRIIIKFESKIKSNFYKEKYRILYSLIGIILIGIFVLPLIGKNFFSLLWEILNRLLNPAWGAGRLNSTVAENAQPYLTNWIGTTGKTLFYLFVLGIVFLSIKFSSGIHSKKSKILLTIGSIAMVFGILFSRISASSILNGSGIFSLSGLLYLGGITLFVYFFSKAYSEEKISIDPFIIIMFSWMLVMIITGRSTTRLFFAIAPFVCLLASYAILNLFEYGKNKKLDDVTRVLVIGVLIIGVIASFVSIQNSYTATSNQAQYTGPSANAQWQNAMAWVRENTSEDSVFAHWWDYGYWVETLGKRAAIADGGHFQGASGIHYLGRYVLTTPTPESALSYFKTMKVSHLLIDQTDLGKYPAYSKIGGGGEDELDRYSAIPVIPADEKQTIETANGTRVVFSGGMYLFEDITYNNGDKTVFLPAGKAAVVGVIMDIEGSRLKQPEAVYVYNNVQTRIPVRYVYVDGQLIDFGSGLDVIVDVIPAFTGNSINKFGAAIYLSQKVSKSLFARLYLLNDAFGEYEDVEIAHIEESPIITSLRGQGVEIGSFIYYQGFRGPIKIWDVSNVSEDVEVVEEFWEKGLDRFGLLDKEFK